jgi:excisionase family DNA binding protein
MKLDPVFDVPDDVVLNPASIAELLGVSEETVRRWCRAGKIPCYAPGGHYVIPGSAFKEFMMVNRKTESLGKMVR